MKKNLFFITILSISVIASTQSFAAAPAAPAAEAGGEPDLLLLLDQARTTAQLARVLVTATKAGNMPWVKANRGILFEQMRVDYKAGQLSVLRADLIMQQTTAELNKLGKNGLKVAQDLNIAYHGNVSNHGLRSGGVRAELK